MKSKLRVIEQIEPRWCMFCKWDCKINTPKLMRKTVEPQILTNLISPICFRELLKKKRLKIVSIIFISHQED